MPVLLAGIVLVATACGPSGERDDESLPQAEYPIPTSVSTPQPASIPTATQRSQVDGSLALAHGVVLHPGSDGRLTVSIRWTYQGAAPESFAVDRRRGLLYLDDELFTALSLPDGSTRWQVGSPPNSALEGGLSSDGGDRIGRSGPSGVRVFAPFNFDLTVDPVTGKRTAFRYPAASRPHGEIRPFPRPRPRNPHISVGLNRVVARAANGRVVWWISVKRPMYLNLSAVTVPGGVVFVLATGLVVVLDTP
jgi:hypothetical protein